MSNTDPDLYYKQLVEKQRMVFKDVKFYFATDERDTREYRKIINSLGGKVYKKWSKDITHVLFLGGSIEDLRRSNENNAFLVTPEWLKECYERETRVPEISFFTTPLKKRKAADFIKPQTEKKMKISATSEKKKPKKQRRKSAKPELKKDSVKKNAEKVSHYVSSCSSDKQESSSFNDKDSINPEIKQKSLQGNINSISKRIEKEKVNSDKENNFENPKSLLENINSNNKRLLGINKTEKNRKYKKRKSDNSLPDILPRKVKKKVICCSSCTKEGMEELIETVRLLGTYEFQSEIDDKTTHLVVGANMRTLKVIVAIAKGLCIVRSDWISESRKVNRWLNEADFGVDEWFPAARISQRLHETNSPNELLFNYTTFYIGKDIVFPTKILQNVLESLGGKVKERPFGTDIIIGTPPYNTDIISITETWVFDSLVAWKKGDFIDYITEKKNS